MIVIFTEEELGLYLKEDIRTLAKYYDLPINKEMKKGEIIDLILNLTQQQEETEVELPQMSVRVRRIYESQKE